MPEMPTGEAEAWEALWETDAARCCSCPSCNHYLPDYEKHKDEPCLLQTLIEDIITARVLSLREDGDA